MPVTATAVRHSPTNIEIDMGRPTQPPWGFDQIGEEGGPVVSLDMANPGRRLVLWVPEDRGSATYGRDGAELEARMKFRMPGLLLGNAVVLGAMRLNHRLVPPEAEGRVLVFPGTKYYRGGAYTWRAMRQVRGVWQEDEEGVQLLGVFDRQHTQIQHAFVLVSRVPLPDFAAQRLSGVLARSF